MSHQDHPLLQRPLYAFDLPAELLYTLEPKAQSATREEDVTTETLSKDRDNGAPQRPETPEGAPASATSCALCGLSFATVQEQRSHVRSDLHGYNMKQRMRGLKTVDEKDFDRLVGELDESISGSDSSSSDTSDDEAHDGKRKDTTLSTLLKKQANIADPSWDDFSTKKRKRGSGKPPLLWFSSSKLPSNTSLGIYRALFTPSEQNSDPTTLIQTLQRKQLSAKPQHTQATSVANEGGVPLPRELQPNTSATGPHYFLCMIGGGHFAAMLVSLTPKITKKAGIEDRTATVLAHKTFHRYTTRRKQGGSQSANDSAKGAAHSAGSSLRRYNEAAMTAEVRDLLSEWRSWIDSSELLFIRATGSTNRRTLFGPYEGQVLRQDDERIRGFPFSTRRATQAELMRAFVELTRVQVSTIDEAALKRAEEEAAQKAEKERQKEEAAKATPSKPSKPSKEDEEALLHTTQLQALIRRSKAPGVVSYLSSNNISPDFAFFPAEQNHHAPTSLHLAASLNSAACVTALLTKAGADPTLPNADGKPAFDLAGDRSTRDAFRLARSSLGEARWDWDAAHVPLALTSSEVEARTQAEKAEKAAEEKAEKERRAKDLEELRKKDKERDDEKRDKKFGKGKTILGALEKTAEEKRMEEARGMTPEMRMRLERERRARAAEARLRGNR